MNREFHAYFPFALKDSPTQGDAIAWLVGQSTRLPAAWPEIAQITDDWARLEILSQAIVTPRKEEARMGTRRMAGGLRYWIENRSAQFFDKRVQLCRQLDLLPSPPDLSLFPPGSWSVQLTFTLRKPYISRDDTDFYILDNPVKKEWVFKVPYVAPSQWKGALRAAMVRQLAEEASTLSNEDWLKRRLQLARLFGNEKGVGLDDERFEAYLDKLRPDTAEPYRKRLKEIAPTGFLAGRLRFYPTFFDRIGLEVINPHPRDTGAGRQPIYFECVPAGARGTFTLLYVPLVGPETSADEARGQAAEDLQAVVSGIKAMLTTYGFGAKTSSGYGVAEEDLAAGQLVLNLPDTQASSPAAVADVVEPEEAFREYLDDSGEVKPEFKGHGEGGLMSNSEYKQKGASLGGGSLGEFKRFRAWYISHGEAWRNALRSATEAGSEEPITKRTFSSLDELVRFSDDLLQNSQNGAKGGKDA